MTDEQISDLQAHANRVIESEDGDEQTAQFLLDALWSLREARQALAEARRDRQADVQVVTKVVPTQGLSRPALDTVPECLRDLAGELGDYPIPPYNWPCVYFLIAGGQLVYVGKTTTLAQRLTEHLKSGKQFDRVLTMHVAEESLSTTEQSLIAKLAPCLNTAFVPADVLRSRSGAGSRQLVGRSNR